jgi:hypothetical protein
MVLQAIAANALPAATRISTAAILKILLFVTFHFKYLHLSF